MEPFERRHLCWRLSHRQSLGVGPCGSSFHVASSFFEANLSVHGCLSALLLCRATGRGQASRWTLEMATLWPTPTWAPSRTASSTSTKRWGSTGWRPRARTAWAQRPPRSSCMSHVSYCWLLSDLCTQTCGSSYLDRVSSNFCAHAFGSLCSPLLFFFFFITASGIGAVSFSTV